MAMTVIIAYDIASDRRRTKLATTLESWGYRLQESVFQLRLDRDGLTEVRESINGIISPSDDVVHIYPLCVTCEERSEVHGTAPVLDDVGLYRGVW